VACAGANTDASDIRQRIWGGYEIRRRGGMTSGESGLVLTGKRGREVLWRVTRDGKRQGLWRDKETSAKEFSAIWTCGREISVKNKHKGSAGRTALGLASTDHQLRVVRHTPCHTSPCHNPSTNHVLTSLCIILTAVYFYISLLHKVPLERVLPYPKC